MMQSEHTTKDVQPAGVAPALLPYTRAIAGHFPGQPLHTMQFFAEGWANRLILVNDEWVFRFPLDDYSAQQLEHEIRLLPRLAPYLPVAVPNFTYTAPGSDLYPHLFAGYRMIPGVALRDAPEGTHQATWWREQAAEFLSALHRIPLEVAAEAGLTIYRTAEDWREAVASKHEPYQRYVFPLLTAEVDQAIDRFLRSAILDDRMVSFTPVILHQDFGFQNFLVDPTAERLTGVIDFANCMLGDPVVDVAAEIFPYYRGAIDAGWQFRREYYRRTSALEDLLYLYTCKHEIPNMEASKKRKIEEIMRIFKQDG